MPINKQILIKKASQQALCEALGFDEGRAYYLILTNKNKDLEKEFSYSKKYRLLKSLFESAAIGKLKTEDKDFFGYVLLPPTFLYSDSVDSEIIAFLEDIYLKNHLNVLLNGFCQVILRNEKWLALFLVNYLMKDNAKLLGIDLTPLVVQEILEK